MDEIFSLKDFAQMEKDFSCNDEDAAGIFECVTDLEASDDGLEPMKDETSRGYATIITQKRGNDFSKSLKFRRSAPTAYDTSRIKSGIVKPRNNIFLSLESVKIRADQILSSTTKFSIERDSDNETKAIKAPKPDLRLSSEIVDDFARQLLEALK